MINVVKCSSHLTKRNTQVEKSHKPNRSRDKTSKWKDRWKQLLIEFNVSCCLLIAHTTLHTIVDQKLVVNFKFIAKSVCVFLKNEFETIFN